MTVRIHTYAASFGDDLAAKYISNNTRFGDTVLDCFSGLGTTLVQARHLGRESIGIDVDPIACLVSRVATQNYSEQLLNNFRVEVLERIQEMEGRLRDFAFEDHVWTPGATVSLDEMPLKVPDCPAISYWFAPVQRAILSYLMTLVDLYETSESRKADILRLSISSSIIRKWPNTLSLARDIDHSRPHKVNRGDLTVAEQVRIFRMVFAKTVRILIQIAGNPEISATATVIQGDVSSGLSGIASSSIDYILTSPPYYNAIDYPRAHRFSEWWLYPHREPLMRQSYLGLRSAGKTPDVVKNCDAIIPEWVVQMAGIRAASNGNYPAICRYILDIDSVIRELSRILKTGKLATIILSNNSIQGYELPVCEIAGNLMELNGFSNVSIEERTIQTNRRRYPFGITGFNGLMHSEKVIQGIRMSNP